MSNRQETTRLTVRSALFTQRTGGLVVRWVTTSEYPLLYVFCSLTATNIMMRMFPNRQLLILVVLLRYRYNHVVLSRLVVF
jgi:hypothetical protein